MITKSIFGTTPEGVEVSLFKLENSKGMSVEITNWGGIIVSITVPDRDGKFDDVTLGSHDLNFYLKNPPYFGCIVGRHANRIEASRFELNGVVYEVAKNDGDNHLHGGWKGFDKVVWQASPKSLENGESLELSYLSPDGEENYPGNLTVKVIYVLTDDNSLEIHYEAQTDKDTVVNLTNHAYFNLAGHASGDVLNHEMFIDADFYTTTSAESTPNGEIRKVQDTPLDFTKFTRVGESINSGHQENVNGKGYDHNWILRSFGDLKVKAAEVYEPTSGRVMEVYTSKPGIQFYSGNYLSGFPGKDGAVYNKRNGLCLETQYFPNALMHKHFPSPILKAGETYKHTTVYTFKAR